MKTIYKTIHLTTLCLLLCVGVGGCFFTKIVSVPLRVGAAAVSVVPVVGNEIHDSIDIAAESIDEVPI